MSQVTETSPGVSDSLCPLTCDIEMGKGIVEVEGDRLGEGGG